jgi:predicted phosphodiesterase
MLFIAEALLPLNLAKKAMKIGLLSDTHSFLDDMVFDYFSEVDEIWHAGDIGNQQVADRLEAFKPASSGVWQYDGTSIRSTYPNDLSFTLEGVSVWMTHIGVIRQTTMPGCEKSLPNLIQSCLYAGTRTF